MSLSTYSSKWRIEDPAEVSKAMVTAASEDDVLLNGLVACERYGRTLSRTDNIDNIDSIDSIDSIDKSESPTIIALRGSEGGLRFLDYAIRLIKSKEHCGSKPAEALGHVLHEELRNSGARGMMELVPRGNIERLLQVIIDAL